MHSGEDFGFVPGTCVLGFGHRVFPRCFDVRLSCCFFVNTVRKKPLRCDSSNFSLIRLGEVAVSTPLIALEFRPCPSSGERPEFQKGDMGDRLSVPFRWMPRPFASIKNPPQKRIPVRLRTGRNGKSAPGRISLSPLSDPSSTKYPSSPGFEKHASLPCRHSFFRNHEFHFRICP